MVGRLDTTADWNKMAQEHRSVYQDKAQPDDHTLMIQEPRMVLIFVVGDDNM